MTPRRISVHQLGPGSSVRDGAAETMLFVRRLVGELGFTSEVFVDGGDAAMPSPFRRANELRSRPQDLLLIHHGHCQERLDWLSGLRCRKTLIYHGAPPRCVAPDSRDHHLAVKAYAQLAPLRGIVDAAIALSGPGARRLRQRGFADVTTISLFPDRSDLRTADYTDPFERTRPPVFRILNIGRIADDNRQRALVRFVARCAAIDGLPVELVLLGQGEPDRRYRAAVEDDIASLGLADRVVLVAGRVSDGAFAGYCRTADACVALGEGEAEVGSLFAAMALDLPVVAYTAPEVEELLGNAALLIRDRDPATIFAAVARLHRDRPFRRELIRRQRAASGGARIDRLRQELRAWLTAMGAYETRPLLARLVGWRAARDARPNGHAGPNGGAGGTQYIVAPQPLENAIRPLALALGRLSQSALADRVASVRFGPSVSPIDMLGDVRLVHVGEAAMLLAPGAAGLINRYANGVVATSGVVARAVRNSGVDLPIAVVGRGFDDIVCPRSVAERRAAFGPVSPAAPFTFLCLGAAQVANGIEELLTAYCLAFTREDPVLLVVSAPDDEDSGVDLWVKRLASGAHSPSVQVVPEPLAPAETELLFGVADAAILPVPAGGSSPAALAMVSGIQLIAAACGEHLDYCTAENTVLIDFSASDLITAMQGAYRDGRAPDSPSARRASRGQQDLAGLRWSDIAAKIDDFVNFLDHRPVMNRKIRVAWVSTYNSRCGLATHSEHLLEHFDRQIFDVTVIGNHQEPLRPEPANVVRRWPDRSGSLDSVRGFIGKFDAVFVNFHFSLMEIHDLAALLKAAQSAAIDTFVTLHKTVDTVIDGRLASLAEIAEVLRACTRLIVHTEADIARLKTFAIIDNVVMIPPGVIDRPALNAAVVRGLLSLQHFTPIVGTFGFLLPPKGLQQLIHAFALVLRHYPEAMLLMLNAEFPGAAESAEERERCRALIGALGLEDRVRLVDEFLETDEILLLLNACDVTVFTYQDSTESDSGAVRLGLAAGRPVATTPLPVFANLKGVVHQLAGGSATDIADGIVALLGDPGRSAAIVARQREWIAANSWAAQAKRIGNIIRGCFEERHRVELRPPAAPLAGPSVAVPDREPEPGTAATLREMIALVDPGPTDWRVRRAQ